MALTSKLEIQITGRNDGYRTPDPHLQFRESEYPGHVRVLLQAAYGGETEIDVTQEDLENALQILQRHRQPLP
jgi:hypothetical protein